MKLRSIVKKKAQDAELDQELAFHLEELKKEYVAAGMAEREAIAAARRSFGSQAALAEECRDQRQTAWLGDFLRDIRYAFRAFLRNPTVTTVAVATLAVCIGLNAGFLVTAYSIAFKPLPYPSPDRLIALQDISGLGAVTSLREIAKAVDYAGYSANNEVTLQAGADALRLESATVTWNLLRVLGAVPDRGRWFNSQEESPGANRVVVLSNRMWRDRFESDSSVLGRSLLIDDQPYRIIGIMPDGFNFPSPETELWIPVNIDPRRVGDMWGGDTLTGIGRLRSGRSLQQASAELPSLVNQVRRMFPWRMPDAWGASAHLVSLRDALTDQIRPKLIVLALGAFLLLLIGCVNVMNLLVTQGIRRKRELALREALGAKPGRLRRQLFTENAVLVAAGSALGLLVAIAVLKLFPTMFPAGTPLMGELTVSTTVLIAVFSGTLVAAVLFGFAPFLQVRYATRESLTAKAMTPSYKSSVLSIALIGGELALGTALMTGAGLMGRSLIKLNTAHTGLNTTGVISTRISFGKNACRNPEQCWASMRQLTTAIANQPGVASVSWANVTPFAGVISAVAVTIEDHPKPAGAPAYVFWETSVTPAYFQQLGVSLRKGRLLNDADRRGTEPVILISEATAKRFWPQGDAIGKRIQPYAGRQSRIVVGIVSNASDYSVRGFPDWVDGVEYEPLSQSLMPTRNGLELSLFVKAFPLNSAISMIEKLPSRFADTAISHLEPLERVQSQAVSGERSTTTLLGVFAVLGLLLAIIGIQGVVAHRIGQRTRELGIRLALGASVGRVIQMVLIETLAVALIGIGAGLLGATALTRVLHSMLFGVTSHDLLTFVGSPLVLLIAAITAALIPALKVLRLDPALILRED